MVDNDHIDACMLVYCLFTAFQNQIVLKFPNSSPYQETINTSLHSQNFTLKEMVY